VPPDLAPTRAGRSARPWRWPAVLAWAVWALIPVALLSISWVDRLLRAGGRADLSGLASDDIPYVLAVLSAVTVGAVVASRRPDHPVGWLLEGLGLSIIVAGLAEVYAAYGGLVRPGALPGVGWAAGLADVSWVPMAVCAAFILLLTPTGSLPSRSRAWQWWAWLTVLAAAVTFMVLASTPAEPFEMLEPPYRLPSAVVWVGWAGAIVINAAVLVGGVSLVGRFRRATGVERQQLRWVALAAGLSILAVTIAMLAWALGAHELIGLASAGYVIVVPVAVGAAVLRYRLYDLDRIINRAVVYGLLTVLLGSCYGAVVLAAGQLLGRDSSLVVAGATLAVAALFQPARRQVQDVVDRRFDRRRYDAAATIRAFSTRLREQVELDTLPGELLEVVDRTMSPTRASLWLRPR
jgi:hypothetical protein